MITIERLIELFPNLKLCVEPIQKKLEPFQDGPSRFEGVCTDHGVVDDSGEYSMSTGGTNFMHANDIPDGFFWVGLEIGMHVEQILVMWHYNNRKFWFYDRYAGFYGGCDDSFEKTNKLLGKAIHTWNTSSGDVIYSYPYGGTFAPD